MEAKVRADLIKLFEFAPSLLKAKFNPESLIPRAEPNSRIKQDAPCFGY